MVVADAADLNGVSVLVTRPAPQAGSLTQLIQRAGGVARLFPVVEIIEPADNRPLSLMADQLHHIDLAIFISPNAVIRAMRSIRSRGKLPSNLQLACVGRGSARELRQLGYTEVIAPQDQASSEALLAMPVMHAVADKKIVIFRGDGGRETLGDTLRARGASVEYVECYRRVRPEVDVTSLIHDWRQGGVNIVSITSTQGLENLYAMLGESGCPCLLKSPVVVLSERTARVCRELGFSTEPLVTADASDLAILQTIQAWRARQNSL